jgi:ribokinase
MEVMDVVGFGSLCIDFVFKVDEYPKRGTSNLSRASVIDCGGTVGNFLVGCSRLGLKCGVVGVVGSDHYGQMIVERLTSSGIDTSMLIVDGRRPTAKVVCIVDGKGERTFMVDPGVQARVELPEEAREYVTKCRAFHTDCLDVKWASLLLRGAKRRGVMTSADVGLLAEHALQGVGGGWVDEVVEWCDVVFVSEANAKKLFPGLSPLNVLDRVLQRGANLAVMTLGRRGCVVADGSTVARVKAFEVEVVDTTGAGDAFEAGFVFSLLKGLDAKSAALLGCAVAAIKCTKLGAQAGLPTLDEIRAFLRERGYGSLASSLS